MAQLLCRETVRRYSESRELQCIGFCVRVISAGGMEIWWVLDSQSSFLLFPSNCIRRRLRTDVVLDDFGLKPFTLISRHVLQIWAVRGIKGEVNCSLPTCPRPSGFLRVLFSRDEVCRTPQKCKVEHGLWKTVQETAAAVLSQDIAYPGKILW